MKVAIFLKQPQGYKAFVLDQFPPETGFSFSSKLMQKASQATLLALQVSISEWPYYTKKSLGK